MLQAQLMNGRQNKAASLGVNAVNVSESPMPPSARACNAEEATGWGGRASCSRSSRRPSQEINSPRGACDSFDDEDTNAPSGASASSHSALHSATKLQYCRSSVAALPLTRSSCAKSSATCSGGQRALTQEDRLDKLTEIAAQQASAINRMSQELTSLASGFGELMHLVDTKSASLKA